MKDTELETGATRRLGAALAEAERTYEGLCLPARADARLRWTLSRRREPTAPRRSGRGWAYAGAALVTATAAWLLLATGVPAVPAVDDAGPSPQLLPGPVAVLTGGAQLRPLPGGAFALAQGRAAVACRGFDGLVEAKEPAELRHEPEGMRLVRGRVTVSVQKRARAEPVRVFVSHGVVEVLGTRFDLDQGPAGGEVHLYEGVIRFSDGATTRVLTPGQSLRWPHAVPPPPAAVAPLAPAVASAASSVHSASDGLPAGSTAGRRPFRRPSVQTEGLALAELLDAVAALRTRGRFGQAARDLDRALAGRWHPATRERLSFELGSILSDHLADAERACAHWAGHQRRFDSGRYEAEVAGARRRLGCTADGDR